MTADTLATKAVDLAYDVHGPPQATAALLGEMFPIHHAVSWMASSGYTGQPEAFGAKLRQVLDEV